VRRSQAAKVHLRSKKKFLKTDEALDLQVKLLKTLIENGRQVFQQERHFASAIPIAAEIPLSPSWTEPKLLKH
jgi:hypothetical protein